MKNSIVERQETRTSRSLLTCSRMVLAVAFLSALLMLAMIPTSAFSKHDLFALENDQGKAAFAVEDNGTVFTTNQYLCQAGIPGLWLDETGEGHKGAFMVLDNGVMQVQRRAQGYGGYEAQVVRFSIHAPNDALRIEPSGHVGLGTMASHPLHMKNGAYVSEGGAWVDGSSREYKQDIKALSVEEALAAFTNLKPMKFKYKLDPTDDQLGFIAEDVPELVATKDRKGMSPMDLVAVLTKVVQEQQRVVQEQQKVVQEQQKMVVALTKRVEALEK